MRRLVWFVLLAGCLRARATAVHPTDLERTSNASSGNTIARGAEIPQAAETSATIGSIEVGALVPFRNDRDSARVHVAPGIRIFGSDPDTVLFGVAIGADFANRFAFEGTVYVGDGDGDPEVIDQAVDLFAGVAMDARSMSIAIGPSVGLLMMPGGNSVVMVGLGLRLTRASE